MNNHPQDNVATIGNVREPTNISSDPPPNFMSVVDDCSPVADNQVSEKIMIKDDMTSVRVIPILTSLNIFQKPSSSKAHFYFRLYLSSEASNEKANPYQNDVVPPTPKNTSEGHQDSPT